MPVAGFVVHIIDDDGPVRESLEALLCVSGFEVETYGSAEDYLAHGGDVEGCIVLDIPPPQSFLRHPRRPIEPGWRCLDG